MELANIETVLSLLKKHSAAPKDKLGQNFLISSESIEEMISAADLNKEDLVLEVGPGVGVLTSEISKQAKDVFACELDRKMVSILNETVENQKNVTVFQGDVLKKEFYLAFKEWLEKRGTNRYKIVSNLPYQITSYFLRVFLSYEFPPEKIVLMLQKEVVERVLSKNGSHTMLSLSVLAYAKPLLVSTVGKEAFYPAPSVDSAILSLDLNQGFLKTREDIDEKLFFRILKAGFSSKRKTLYNNLYNSFKLEKEFLKEILEKLELSSSVRAEELSILEWAKIYDCLKKSL